ncbi:hypothetical protein TNIN_237421 [Trichonephila inaurata madagascariensis]|uniref:Uncharacterized protein n=1 Tax=Trichonephila inaurata madagascariensis TaxID=2747483 RepID=A0A8X6J4W5_9ARAC|nr:hypothetical protein TNIN_237421 [Trichonephila inaurata madagascariensis]
MSDIDSPKLQNSVFKRLAKPEVTIHGDLWCEGKAVPPCWGRKRRRENLQDPFSLRWTPVGETLRSEIGSVLKNDRGS